MYMPEREFDIHAKGLSARDAEKVQSVLRSEYRYGTEPYEKELKKSKEDLLWIKKINSYILAEFKRLGIERKPPRLTPQRFHFLNSEMFDRVHGSENDGAKVAGAFHDKRIEILMNVEVLSKDKKLRSMLHEAIHAASFRNFWVDTERKDIEPYRSGYAVINREDPHEHFRGLHEAITEKSLQDILAEHADEISETFGNEVVDYDRGEYKDYQNFINLVDIIVSKVAEKHGEPPQEVWTRFKRGLYTGEMMHLREIERAYGKGSLRFLAALESGTRRALTRDEVMEKMRAYFSTEDEEEREKLAHEVLNERERLRYDKRAEPQGK